MNALSHRVWPQYILDLANRFWAVELPELESGEEIVLDTNGYLVRGALRNVCRIVLTSRRLLILSYRVPILPGDHRLAPHEEIWISDITKVERFGRTPGWIGFGLVKVRTVNGTVYELQLHKAVVLKQRFDQAIN